MAQASHETDVYYAVPDVWHFVSDMDNWAPLMPGYVSHEKINANESKWKIRGDLGFISRVVEFAVTITEWREPSPDGLIAFTLRGLNELVDGGGSFKIEPGDIGEASAPTTPTTQTTTGWLGRFYLWLFKLIRPFKTVSVGVDSDIRETSPRAPYQGAPTRMILNLELNPGGPMGKMVDKMVGPLLPPEAEGLAARILSEMEIRSRSPEVLAC